MATLTIKPVRAVRSILLWLPYFLASYSHLHLHAGNVSISDAMHHRQTIAPATTHSIGLSLDRRHINSSEPILLETEAVTLYIYSTHLLDEFSSRYRWEEVAVQVIDGQSDRHALHLAQMQSTLSPAHCSYFVPQPVYVSLTTMHHRVGAASRTVRILLTARVRPSHIFLFVSREKFLLDEGVQDLPQPLLFYVAAGFLTVVFTENIGPHRKLLPLLHRYYSADVFIATVDDDMGAASGYSLLYQLLKQHHINAKKSKDSKRTSNKSIASDDKSEDILSIGGVDGGSGGEAVVALRVRRMGMCETAQPPAQLTRYYAWTVLPVHGRREMLVMPTGTGGILYRPRYFHPIVFDPAFRDVTGTADDLMFRLATMGRGIPVAVGCADIYYKNRLLRKCVEDKFDARFNQTAGTGALLYRKRQRRTRKSKKLSGKASSSSSSSTKDGKLGDNKDLIGNDGGERRLLLQAAPGSILIQVARDPIPSVNTAPAHSLLATGVTIGSEIEPRYASTEVMEAGLLENCSQTSARMEEAQRKLAVKVNTVEQAKNRNFTELFAFNRRGANDVSWWAAVHYLEQKGVLDMQALLNAHYRERDSICYRQVDSVIHSSTLSSTLSSTSQQASQQAPLVASNSSADSSKKSYNRSLRVARFCSLYDCAVPFLPNSTQKIHRMPVAPTDRKKLQQRLHQQQQQRQHMI